jgi:hypothetical protein
MSKQKKEKLIKVEIQPKQIRDALETTIAEQNYTKAIGFKKEAEKKIEEFNKTFGPYIEKYKEMAKEINEMLSSSGFFEAIKKTQKSYSKFLKDLQPPEVIDTYILPEKRNHINLTNEDINLISEKAAEKISNIIKGNTELRKSDKWMTFRTKENLEFKFNRENGDVKLGGIQGNIAPGTQEYKILLCILESPSYITKYVTLLKTMYPNQNFEEPLKKHQVDMWALNTTIRNIKRTLGILPRKNAANKDIFRTLKKHKAYSLSLET